MKSLFNITAEARELASALIEGELSSEIELALVINQTELQEKAINYGFVIKGIESDMSIIDSEIERLKALKTSRSNAIDRIKSAVLEAMEIYGIEKVTSPTLNLSIRKSESVEIDSAEQLGECYKTRKETVTPDKVAIKKKLLKTVSLCWAQD